MEYLYAEPVYSCRENAALTSPSWSRDIEETSSAEPTSSTRVS
ncbi:hypothetical protein [Streptomyces sp. NBC_00338]|nr:hypothetical protein [Streptomyces sp. NBC_00338]MCX5142085.1 hypothetical protein [Streptomyces sp. NBC_00338]